MDLWAHFQERDQLPTHDVRRSGRRFNERSQIALLRDWLLHDYIAAYCRLLATTRIFRRYYWIDALGLDSQLQMLPDGEEGEATSDGKRRKSKKARGPVPLALQPLVTLSDALAGLERPITLYGLLLAMGSSRRKDARSGLLLDNGDLPTALIPKESGIIQASWLEMASPLLRVIDQAPALFLLNPLSPTLFCADDLAALYMRAVPTELCLRLSHKQIIACLQSALSDPEQAGALNKLLRTDRWKALSTEDEAQTQAIEGFVALLIASIQRSFQYPIQPVRFPLPLGAAYVEEAPYTLLFATRRLDSLYCLNDALYQLRQRAKAASYRGILGETWFLEQQQGRYQETLQELADSICQQVQTQRRIRWPDLRQQLLLARFGQIPVHDYDITIQQLLLKRVISCAWRQSGPVEERVPGLDDTLIWR